MGGVKGRERDKGKDMEREREREREGEGGTMVHTGLKIFILKCYEESI